MEWSELLSLVSGVATLLIGGGGLLYVRQERRSRELQNESAKLSNEASSNEEWIRLYREMQAEVKEQRDMKVELRNEITELRVKLKELEGWRCDRTNCTNRRPPSAVTMTQDRTND